MEKVKFGLSNVYFAPRTETDGAVTYGTPVAVPGAVSASISRNASQNIFYADNGPYFVSNDKSNQTIDLEIADVAKQIMLDYLGYVENEGGGILETDNAVTPHFALMFQIETDEAARKFCYYNCSASEGDEDHNTKEEQVEPQTSNLSVTCTGETLDDGERAFRNISYKGDANYDTFFTKVGTPAKKAKAA